MEGSASVGCLQYVAFTSVSTRTSTNEGSESVECEGSIYEFVMQEIFRTLAAPERTSHPCALVDQVQSRGLRS